MESLLGYFNIYIVDSIVGICISIWILFIGLKLFISSYLVLIDTNLKNDQIKDIQDTFYNNSKILKLYEVIAKPVGCKYLIILKVNIEENSNINSLEDEIIEIKEILKDNFEYVYDVIFDLNC